jgi:ORF6N domain
MTSAGEPTIQSRQLDEQQASGALLRSHRLRLSREAAALGEDRLRSGRLRSQIAMSNDPCGPQALAVCTEVVDQSREAVALELVPAPAIQKRILVVRERQVMLDEDLADLYGVETRRLIEQVKRNIERFPADFMFQLSKEEAAALRSQTATSGGGRGGRRYAPYVFTEQGVAMLSSVLRSKRAVAVNIAIMRAFVELRRAAASYAAIEKKLEALERETKGKLGQHDQQLSEIFQALRQLISPPSRPRRKVGFRPPEDEP